MKKYEAEWEGDSQVNVVKAKQHLGPESLAELRQIVRDATARGQKVKAHGAGHSYSDITQTEDVLVDLRLLKGARLADPDVLKPDEQLRAALGFTEAGDEKRKKPRAAQYLVWIEAGITVKELNDKLWGLELAAANLGSYNKQSYAGATSTGTHGSGLRLGPIHESIRSITLVTTGGDVLRIEPTNGITDPRRWREPDVRLVQDDDRFNSVLVSMGTMGVIYSCIVQAQDAYWLEEKRQSFERWQEAKDEIRTRDLLDRFRHVELYVNPNPIKGKHACVLVTRKIADVANPLTRKYDAKADGARPKNCILNIVNALESASNLKKDIKEDVKEFLTGTPKEKLKVIGDLFKKKDQDNVPEDAKFVLADFVNLFPKKWAALLNQGLMDMDNHEMRTKGYRNRSYEVFLLDVNGADAYGIEASFPYEGLNDLDEKLSIVFQFFERQMERGHACTTPMGIRFVKGSRAYLSPDHGRDSVRLEIGMVAGTNKGKQMLEELQERLQRAGGRLHWGLHLSSLDVSPAQMRRQYPMYERWVRAYRELNVRGVFSNRFTRRMGL